MEDKPSKSLTDGPFHFNDSGNEAVTCDQIRAKCDHWSLGDNIKLLSVLKNLSDDLVSRSEETCKKLDDVVHETEIKSVGVKNLINEFQMLADSQFIENRVCDGETPDLIVEDQKEPGGDSKEGVLGSAANQQILPVIQDCITNNLKFIDETFEFAEKIGDHQIESDEEEDFVNEALARALQNNPFNRAPLPSIIGSQEFFNQSIFKTTEENVFDPRKGGYEGENDAREEYISDASEDEIEEGEDLFKPDPDDDTQSISTRTSIHSGSRILSNAFTVTSNPEVVSINREAPEPVKGDNETGPQESDADDLFEVPFPPKLTEQSKIMPNKLLDQVKNHILAKSKNTDSISYHERDDEDDLFKSEDEDEENLFVIVKKKTGRQPERDSEEKAKGAEPSEKKDLTTSQVEKPSKSLFNAQDPFRNAQLIAEVKRAQRKSSLLSESSEDDSDDFLFGNKEPPNSTPTASHSLSKHDDSQPIIPHETSQKNEKSEKSEKSSTFKPFSGFSDDSDSDDLFRTMPKKPPVATRNSLSKVSDKPKPIDTSNNVNKKIPSFLSDGDDDDDDLFFLPKVNTLNTSATTVSRDEPNQTSIIQPQSAKHKENPYIPSKLPTGAIKVLPSPSSQVDKGPSPKNRLPKLGFNDDDDDDEDDLFSSAKSDTTKIQSTTSRNEVGPEAKKQLPKLDYNSDDDEDDDLFSPSKSILSKLPPTSASRPTSQPLLQPSSPEDDDLLAIPKATPNTINPIESSLLVKNVQQESTEIHEKEPSLDEPLPGPAPKPKPRKSIMKKNETQEKEHYFKGDTSDEDLFKVTASYPISKEKELKKNSVSDEDFPKNGSRENLINIKSEKQPIVQPNSILQSDSDSDDSLFGGFKPMPNAKLKEKDTPSKYETSKVDSILGSILSTSHKDTKTSNYDWNESDSDDLFKPRK